MGLRAWSKRQIEPPGKGYQYLVFKSEIIKGCHGCRVVVVVGFNSEICNLHSEI
jgi:hypothetical protein